MNIRLIEHSIAIAYLALLPEAYGGEPPWGMVNFRKLLSLHYNKRVLQTWLDLMKNAFGWDHVLTSDFRQLAHPSSQELL